MKTMNTKMDIRSYSDLIKIEDFDERFKYLSLDGNVGSVTFGGHRYLNQILYQTEEWKHVRREAIIRDNGCDLAHEDYQIFGSIYIHHINPITIDDILKRKSCVFDLDNLICTTFKTHNALHFGNEEVPYSRPAIRSKNDTSPWK